MAVAGRMPAAGGGRDEMTQDSIEHSSGVWFLTGGSGELRGKSIREQRRALRDLAGVFTDEAARQAMDGGQPVYRVQLYLPVEEGTEGGLFFGNTTIEPGRVGDEYFMTKGHFHAKRDRGEYYWCLRGRGALILMGEDRSCRVEWMAPGSLHYIPGHTAHRVANTGEEPLTFGACWPADAGHDYDSIARDGFSMRLRCIDGRPALVPASAR
jgi:glucose-6-phosphate isomerase